jgi:SAM-dependent methyltransferase
VSAEGFKAFEAAGWSDRAGTFETLMARATAAAVEPLLDAAGVASGTRVLDVGCGLGDLAAAAAARGSRVTGVDLAEGMLAAARARHPGIEFVHGDVERLPFADAAFDVVLAAFVVNHVPDAERAAAELARVCRGRVALAMWGPPEEVALLGLPAQAVTAAGLDHSAIPEGPSSLRFTDAAELVRLLDGLDDVRTREVRFDLQVESLDDLWDGVLGGTVRTAARITRATPEQRDRARAELARLAEPHRRGGGYALPTTIRIATACCPR